LKKGGIVTASKEPPAHLGESGRALWRDVAGKYGLRADELAVLLRACETADTIDAMNAALVGQPLTVPGSQGQLQGHPLISEKRQQVALQARLLAQLKLPNTDAGAASDPSAAGRSLVRARYDKRLRSV
jgi:hypothetical protein